MQVRICTETDRRIAAAWMSSRIKMNFPEDWFIKNTGIAVTGNGGLRAVIILYVESAGNIAQIGWTMTNPDNSPRQSHTALKLGIDAAVSLARNLGVRYLLSYIAVPGIVSLLENAGFVHGDPGVKQRYKVLY